jgi:lysophospholipid acyltransferase
VILDFGNSIAVWSRVYFYAIVTTFASLAFFASPGKKWLKAQHEKRSHDAGVKIVKNLSTESLTAAGGRKEPILGLSQDPEADANEMVDEIRAQVERAKAEQVRRRSRGQSLQDAVKEKTQFQFKTKAL